MDQVKSEANADQVDFHSILQTTLRRIVRILREVIFYDRLRMLRTDFHSALCLGWRFMQIDKGRGSIVSGNAPPSADIRVVVYYSPTTITFSVPGQGSHNEPPQMNEQRNAFPTRMSSFCTQLLFYSGRKR